MKKLTVLFLALFLLVLAGCHTDVPEGTTEPQTDPIVETTLIRPPEPTENPYENPPFGEETPVIQVQYLPAEVSSEEDVPILKWVCLMESFQGGTQNRVWNEEAVYKLNEMLDALEAGFRIQFVMVTADKMTLLYDWFSRPEVQELVAEADLLYGYMTRENMQQYLSPITQYTAGMLKDAVPHSSYWSCGMVNGEIYGIRTNVTTPFTMGWYVDESVLATLNLTSADFTGAFWEMDEILDMLASYYDAPFLYVSEDNISRDAREVFWRGYYPSSLQGAWDLLHRVGSCYAIDYSGKTPKVVNFLELKDMRLYQEAVIRYKKLGYVTNDWETVKLRYAYGSHMESTSVGDERYVPVTEPFFNPSAAGYFSGIAAGSEHKEEAASLLGLIANSEDFRMQLFFGKEGRDYTDKDGMYTITKQEDGSDYSMDFLSPLAYFCDLTQDWEKASSKSPATDNTYLEGDSGAEKLENLRRTLDVARIGLPVSFDFTDYEEECEDIYWVLRRYYPYITNEKTGKYTKIPEMTPALYDLMLMDLEDAGSGILQQELQDQLDNWLKENPDWE